MRNDLRVDRCSAATFATRPKRRASRRIGDGTLMSKRILPELNNQPPLNGPMALPMALKDVANPFRVPSTLRLVAEFVNRIVEHGKANIDALEIVG